MTEHDLVLRGPDVVLTPAHPDDATEAWALTDAELWAGMTTPWPESVEAHAARIDQQRQTPGLFAFTVRDAVTSGIRGSTTFYDHTPAQGRVEIGTTWYGRAFQGGRTNPATKLLLLTHAFDVGAEPSGAAVRQPQHPQCPRDRAARCDARGAPAAAPHQRRRHGG
ncbi:GNAT family N-acetyltransferase [Microbacterium sp. Leaf179]|uniref:GNAT family N-acetyltransferase n=1 Tax=Microbacterium sp. Leaf179 TaxID=1736288 RepID=UPI000B2D90C8|nr:GNAT family protein [Microbacterium sp. Leaf179]